MTPIAHILKSAKRMIDDLAALQWPDMYSTRAAEEAAERVSVGAVADVLLAIRDALHLQQAQGGWIKCSERLPALPECILPPSDEGTISGWSYLVAVEHHVFVATFWNEVVARWSVRIEGRWEDVTPTHWQPIPATPSKG